MVKISKREAQYMRENGYEEFVKHTFSKHKKYYLVEEQNDIYKYNQKKGKRVLVRLSAMNKLKEFRRSIGITD